MTGTGWLMARLFICLIGCGLVTAWGLDEGSSWAATALAIGLTCWALWVVTSPAPGRRP